MKTEAVPNVRREDLTDRVLGMLTVKRFAEKRGIIIHKAMGCDYAAISKYINEFTREAELAAS